MQERALYSIQAHFVQLMRDQGIAANATPRVVRGRNKAFTKDGIYRMKPSTSRALRARVISVARELNATGVSASRNMSSFEAAIQFLEYAPRRAN